MTIHACNSGENIVIIFVNNGIYGMRRANGSNYFSRTIKKAFENTRLKKGLSFIEILSNCNSGWKIEYGSDYNRNEQYCSL